MVLRVGGLATGMDIDATVKELMKAHRVPLDKLKQKEQLVTWKRNDYFDINKKMYDYRNNKLFKFTLEGELSSKKAEVTGDAGAVSVKATPSTSVGTLSIQVVGLAQAATNHSSASIKKDASFDPAQTLASQRTKLDSFTSNTFKINGKEITFDPATDSLNSVLAKINSQSNVSAFYDSATGQVSFMAKETGLVNGPEDKKYISFDGDFLTSALKVDKTNTTNAKAAVDADLIINGLRTTRTSNTFTMNGAEITLKSVGSSVVTVSNDVDKTVDAIKKFVDEYNEFLKTLQDKVNETRYRDFAPLSDEQKTDMKDKEIELWEEKSKSGMLRNDPYISGAISSLRTAAISTVDNGSKYNSLYAIGIETGNYSENGKLYLKDEEKLRKAIAEDPNAIVALFSANGNGNSGQGDVGIADRMYASLKTTMDQFKTTAGLEGTTTDNKDQSILGQQLYKMDTDIRNLEKRLIDIEDRYYRQFTAMEKAISTYNSQSSYLSSMFTSNQ
ncbi:Flagellar hook-associated protein 2 [Paenibacillus solanacearum]|uniref:Flagellar hook-associated protein 2 n=1 Tax=Paenibacillus solanacearum TaxID=2048548 RepID=A0A916NJE6_9BACL|nr:flagellar filament capping protein FliD [Paenibacillus solanacearum]CAG7633897.1 Flagellar hook-associated protein 2 [Paenibacillus solanacearum]